MEKYATLIIDLKKSRSYKHADRTDIQNYIKNIISVLNKVYDQELALPVVFSAGDEIQGLFYTPQSAYLYYRLFNMLISPVEIRGGIGVGEWSVKIDSEISTEQDGPAFYNARHAIENADDQLGYSLLLFSGKKDDLYINAAVNGAVLLAAKQSGYQNQLSLLTELMYPIRIDRAVVVDVFDEITVLINQKKEMGYYTKKDTPLLLHRDHHIDCHPVNALEAETQFFITSGKIKGLPGKLAQLLGKTRQSMEKSIKAGNIYQERNATIAALKLMNEYHRED